MPGFDRTGPMTGGVRGHCNSATAGMTPAFAGSYGNGRGQGLRRGFRGGSDSGMGRGRGFGRGYRWSRLAGGPVHLADAASEMEMLSSPLLNCVMASLTVPRALVITLMPACRSTLNAFGPQWPVINMST